MKNQFLGFVNNIRNAEVATMPAYRTMVAIASHPYAEYPDAAIVASCIKINVNDEFVNDPELFEPTVDAYVNALNRVWRQLRADFPLSINIANTMFLNMAREMTLTYTC